MDRTNGLSKLVLTIAIDRLLLIFRGRVKNNEFLSGVPHGNEAYWRINRAHLNTLENLQPGELYRIYLVHLSMSAVKATGAGGREA